MKILRTLLIAACLVLGTIPVGANTHKNHEKALGATFVLYGHSDKRNVEHIPLCTAFAYKKVDDGYLLLTEGHCFDGGAPEDATYLVANGQIVDEPKNLEAVEVLNHVDDSRMDVAELHLKTAKQYPVLELDFQPTQIDDKVFYVGYPQMATQVLYIGRVGSNVIETKPEDCDGMCSGRILVQTGGGPGASGSPVISEKTGKVIGILEGHIFENGVIVVPSTGIRAYYLKEGHSKN
jgi:hypothetical protein